MNKILLYGASGHGKVVADIVRAESRYSLVGFIDDNIDAHGSELGGLRGYRRRANQALRV